MTAVDTNVLVRLVTEDPPRQAAPTPLLFASEPICIAKTYCSKPLWVLRSLYGFENDAIVDAFMKLLGLPKVHVEDKSSIAAALFLKFYGIGLADALARPSFLLTALSFAAPSGPAQQNPLASPQSLIPNP